MITEQQIQDLLTCLREMREECRACFERSVAALEARGPKKVIMHRLALEAMLCDCNAERLASREDGEQWLAYARRELEAMDKGGAL